MPTLNDTMPRHRVDLDIQAAIVDQLNLHGGRCNAAQIHRYLSERPDFDKRVPTVRTVQRIIKNYGGAVDSPEWHWSEYEAEDARILLNVYDMLLNASRGKSFNEIFFDDATEPSTGDQVKIDVDGEILFEAPTDFRWSKEFANWVIKVFKVCPGLNDEAVFHLARYYLLANQLGYATSELDELVAAMPWRTPESLKEYLEDIQIKEIAKISIPGAHLHLFMAMSDYTHMTKFEEVSKGDEDPEHQRVARAQLRKSHEDVIQLIWETAR